MHVGYEGLNQLNEHSIVEVDQISLLFLLQQSDIAENRSQVGGSPEAFFICLLDIQETSIRPFHSASQIQGAQQNLVQMATIFQDIPTGTQDKLHAVVGIIAVILGDPELGAHFGDEILAVEDET